MHAVRVTLLNLFLSAAVIALAASAFWMDRFCPFSLPGNLIPAAWPLFFVGGYLIIWALLTLARTGGASGAPGDPPKKLVKTGPYAWMRNPIYFGDGLILTALALYTSSPTMLVYTLLYGFAIERFVRWVEEPAVEKRFGDEYHKYKEDVPRWLPKVGRGRG